MVHAELPDPGRTETSVETNLRQIPRQVGRPFHTRDAARGHRECGEPGRLQHRSSRWSGAHGAHATIRLTHESNDSLQALSDDGPGVLHLGRVAPADLRLPAEPRLQRRPSSPGSSTPSRSPPSSACSSATSSPTGISPRRSSSRSATSSAASRCWRCVFTHGRSGRSSALMLVHCLLYVPTISITNSIAFAHMKDAQKEFGLVRMGGTIGWILAAWPFTFILVDWDKVHAAQSARDSSSWIGTVLGSGLTGPALQAGTQWTFVVAGIASLLLAAFSLTLPHTPPKPATSGGRQARLARSAAAARASVHPRPVARHVHRRVRPQLLLQLDRHVPRQRRRGRRRRHPRQLDHAGHEHRPDRRDPHDGRSSA